MACSSRAGTTIGGLADDPIAAVDQLPQLGQRLQAVAGARLGGPLAEGLLGLYGLLPGLLLGRRGGGVAEPLQQIVLVQAGVPDLQGAHLGEAAIASR